MNKWLMMGAVVSAAIISPILLNAILNFIPELAANPRYIIVQLIMSLCFGVLISIGFTALDEKKPAKPKRGKEL